jgi:UDP-N-acetylglucosamine diphosphorylase/glucosamine-1-phosphate N-acetyltransferase
MALTIIVLAAGLGTRMRSDLPKALHSLAGKPLLEHVVTVATTLHPRAILVVYGHGGAELLHRLSHLPVTWVEQAEQLGTGHAVVRALPHVPPDDTVVILYGDVPLITAVTLDRLISVVGAGILSIITVELNDPRGYGRIVRDQTGAVQRSVEEKDASPEERAIREVNTGLMAAPAESLKRWLEGVGKCNAQGEYYLTDVIGLAVAEGSRVTTVLPTSVVEVLGVNDRVQLASLERAYQQRQAEALMRQGVTLLDPGRFDLRGELECGRDVVIDVNVVLEGTVRLGNGVRIGPGSVIRNTALGEQVEVLAHCVIDDAVIGPHSRIGPFTRIRPGTELRAQVHLGNFVEVKNSAVGAGSKINHLSYIGDCIMGSNVNVGAGTVTCNYDGLNKHRTVIGDRAFIGSDTQLVAPVEIGPDATIGAGSIITQDAPAGELSLSRAPQRCIWGWKRPTKESSK